MDPEEFDATLRAAATAVTPAPERPIVTDNEPFDYAAWMARLGETGSAAEIAPSSGEQQESASEAFGRVGAPYLNEAALADLQRHAAQVARLQRHAEDASHNATVQGHERA